MQRNKLLRPYLEDEWTMRRNKLLRPYLEDESKDHG
uniref:Uncharacterized protein n=1 Tax=Nelumbo nucifera TaxID=4432 RepID=A0A822ZFN1_NELNU|nr:TPA_asm: hypothetical protein HUJ06_014751 [Nelumbo nucifera]